MPYYDTRFLRAALRGECYKYWWPMLIETQHKVQGVPLDWEY